MAKGQDFSAEPGIRLTAALQQETDDRVGEAECHGPGAWHGPARRRCSTTASAEVTEPVLRHRLTGDRSV
jgi:hypothetical protein